MQTNRVNVRSFNFEITPKAYNVRVRRVADTLETTNSLTNESITKGFGGLPERLNNTFSKPLNTHL